MNPRASCGLYFPTMSDLSICLSVCRESGFDFAVTPIVHPRYRAKEITAETQNDETLINEAEILVRDFPFTRSDLILNSGDWGTLLVGVMSRHLNVDSRNPLVRRKAEEAMKRELNFCSHLGLSAILIELTKPNNSNLARMVYSFILKQGGQQVWIRLPMTEQKSLSDNSTNESPSFSSDSIVHNEGTNGLTNGIASKTKSSANESCELSATWHWWNNFRSCANYEKKLGLALVIEGSEGITDETVINRWIGEPVKALIINTRLFLTNKKGYPVLPRSVQSIVHEFVFLDVQVILEGVTHGHDMAHYQSYMDHLWKQHNTADDVFRTYSKGFEDYLQSPLQPLMDNLESCTYEVFEKDPVKYSEYQRAVLKAIQDKRPNEEEKDKELTVMVLGAGRGPLVKASLEAAKTANRKIRVFAVEKNPNAIVTLMNLKEEVWKDQVTVISSDMRKWRPKEENRADIIVSELLGSFGDNELSPECLYSAQHLFKKDAISIPCSYTSWVGPLQSSKLYNEVRFSFDIEKNPNAHFETPYVVHLQNRVELAKPKPLFTFEHPLREEIDNNRYEALKFKSLMDAQLHGFAGYFECVLYKDVVLSINPDTHSKGMFSWFPIFFPLRTPVKLKKGEEMELHFWRVNNSKEVWYEWTVSQPTALPIHNPGGRSYTIGL